MFPGVEIYLFGSRLDDNGRGGDIDLLLLSEQKIDTRKLRRFRLEFYKKFGWQKIDLINFTKEDNTTFKKIICNRSWGHKNNKKNDINKQMLKYFLKG